MACFLTLFLSPIRGSWCILTPILSSQCSQGISREAGSRGYTPINSPGPSWLQRDLHSGHTGQCSSSRPCGDLLSNALPCPEPPCVAVTPHQARVPPGAPPERRSWWSRRGWCRTRCWSGLPGRQPTPRAPPCAAR